MKLPAKLLILNRAVSIIRPNKVDRENSIGEFNPAGDTIKIKKGINGALLNETMWHEIVHAILMYTGVKHSLQEGQEETIAQALGFALADVLKNNFAINLEE